MQPHYLENPLPLGQHDFAIIDRMQHPDIDKSWPVLEMVSPMLQPQAPLYPWLLPLKEMKADGWQTLMQQLGQATSSDVPPLCKLVFRSDSSAQEIRSSLIKAMLFTDERHQNYIIRYYDPRVLIHFFWMFTWKELMAFLPVNQITHWTLWIEGQWHSLEYRSSQSGSADAESGNTPPFSRLQNIGLINCVLNEMEIGSNIQERQRCSQEIENLLNQGRGLGLEHDDDLIIFTCSALTRSPDFWRAPVIQNLLKYANNKPGIFFRTVRNLSDIQWQEIVIQSGR
ncbi:DUF4123 domain-containing protein [Mixta intestinalis]|uniref:DUF4123 domain-containing protein n=1 Tax=Mixta intestinalis TaxID=1615494 RepID=A0A6P1PZU6_9GAMM|nr:DUF4123 domain-containing protein [Mixta intestinalis]QHM71913.1 hypothetical protein C7M51_02206 [Mixta intestinalis]